MLKGVAFVAIAATAVIVTKAQGVGAAPAAAPDASMPRLAAWPASPLPVTTEPEVAGHPPSPAAAVSIEPADYDVVDAHWMALTMWGEARGEGELAMRAVGHVIDNRRRAGGRHGVHVTDQVTAAWQFSCWNPGDPNRPALDRIDQLEPGSQGHRMWLAARRIAAEIMSEESSDPTGGALFYHTEAVAPAWSRGLAPVARIGPHLFFTRAL